MVHLSTETYLGAYEFTSSPDLASSEAWLMLLTMKPPLSSFFQYVWRKHNTCPAAFLRKASPLPSFNLVVNE